MNPAHLHPPLPPAARELPAAQSQADAPGERGSDDLAWQRALEQASGLDYATWFKPVPVAPAVAAAPAVEDAGTQRARVPLAPRTPSAAPPAETPSVPRLSSDAPQAAVDVPAAREAAFAADLAAAGACLATAPAGAARADVVPAPRVLAAGASGATGCGPLAFSVPPPAREATEAAAPSGHAMPAARHAAVLIAAGEQEPLRVHAQWSADGVSVWLGCDAGALPALDEFIAQLQRALSARGERLARIVCNGREVWHAVPPSGLSASFLPASSRWPLSFNRPYEAP